MSWKIFLLAAIISICASEDDELMLVEYFFPEDMKDFIFNLNVEEMAIFAEISDSQKDGDFLEVMQALAEKSPEMAEKFQNALFSFAEKVMMLDPEAGRIFNEIFSKDKKRTARRKMLDVMDKCEDLSPRAKKSLQKHFPEIAESCSDEMLRRKLYYGR
ncbi:hypothetical protein OESDEN_04320 [Oesophagostomum dentatum]|uniref:Nematode fatty acid retinoid binding protein n=1 Tax=Oesophagostomum dentatum TaxID=61180 RepID=A0A0B1TEQ6_OESDE|nr:hypothetical protein OESDEN_04320 [Oesophagostomum dentatum]